MMRKPSRDTSQVQYSPVIETYFTYEGFMGSAGMCKLILLYPFNLAVVEDLEDTPIGVGIVTDIQIIAKKICELYNLDQDTFRIMTRTITASVLADTVTFEMAHFSRNKNDDMVLRNWEHIPSEVFYALGKLNRLTQLQNG